MGNGKKFEMASVISAFAGLGSLGVPSGYREYAPSKGRPASVKKKAKRKAERAARKRNRK